MELVGAGERYTALLFLPAAVRPFAAAIYAFDDEINKIAQLASEPMPGEIRLQWWREIVGGERSGEGQANPLAKALLETIATHALPEQVFLRYLDAKAFDLYNDPMPDVVSLEAYLGETESFIFQMIGALCDGARHGAPSRLLADACGHCGVAYGIARLLQMMPYHTARRQVYVPGELLAAAGLDAAGWLNGENSDVVLTGMIALGREHLAKAKVAVKLLPMQMHCAFLPLALVGPVLKSAGRRTNGLKRLIEISPLKKQWAVWQAAVFGF